MATKKSDKKQSTKQANSSIGILIDRAVATEPNALEAFIGEIKWNDLKAMYAKLADHWPAASLTRPKLEREVCAMVVKVRRQGSDGAPAGTGDEPGVAPDAAPANVGDQGAQHGGDGADGGDAGANQAAPTAPAKPARMQDSRLPPVGTVLRKTDRHGQVRCEATIVDSGVVYNGVLYKSLSAAAKVAAADLGLKSTTQDGFSFFQLKKAAHHIADPIAALEHAWQRYRERAEAVIASATPENRAQVHEVLDKNAVDLLGLADKVS